MTSTIADATRILDELVNTLDKAYWEASSVNAKDTIYDCFSTISKELLELSKLSIQDHDLSYEPISYEFKSMASRLPIFRKNLDSCVVRNATLENLDGLISSTIQLITHENPTS